MKVFFMRHGHTYCNEKKLHNGQLDEELDAKGVEQARQASEAMKDMTFDVIYCSPLLRARHTCEIINRRNQPVIYDDRLKERTLGVLDGKSWRAEGYSGQQHFNYYHHYAVEGAENWPDLFRRVQSFLDMLRETYTNERILVVCHGALIRAVHFSLCGIPEDGDLSGFDMENCQVREYEL